MKMLVNLINVEGKDVAAKDDSFSKSKKKKKKKERKLMRPIICICNDL